MQQNIVLRSQTCKKKLYFSNYEVGYNINFSIEMSPRDKKKLIAIAGFILNDNVINQQGTEKQNP